MQFFRSKILAFFLLAVAVTFNTGMGFVEHSCLTEGETTVSLQKKNCCQSKKSCTHTQETSQNTVKKASCCEDRTIYVHVDFKSYTQKAEKFFSGLYMAVIQHITHFLRSFLPRGEIALQYTNSSPPASGRQMLTHHCTLQL